SGADVQQVVAALRRDVDEVPDDRLRGLPVGVVRLEPPRVVHRHAAFPVHALDAVGGNLLLGSADVAGVRAVRLVEAFHAFPPRADAVVDDDVGLQAAD